MKPSLGFALATLLPLAALGYAQDAGRKRIELIHQLNFMQNEKVQIFQFRLLYDDGSVARADHDYAATLILNGPGGKYSEQRMTFRVGRNAWATKALISGIGDWEAHVNSRELGSSNTVKWESRETLPFPEVTP